MRDAESNGEIDLIRVEVFYGCAQRGPFRIRRHVVRGPDTASKRSLFQFDITA